LDNEWTVIWTVTNQRSGRRNLAHRSWGLPTTQAGKAYGTSLDGESDGNLDGMNCLDAPIGHHFRTFQLTCGHARNSSDFEALVSAVSLVSRWYDFKFNGQRIRSPRKQTLSRSPRTLERTRRRQLEEGYTSFHVALTTTLLSRTAPQNSFLRKILSSVICCCPKQNLLFDGLRRRCG
jgi:hypothetical protein